MQITQLKREIRFFIVENFLYGLNDGGVKDNASFLANGLIDSTGVLELVSFVEDKYGIAVNDEELIPDNFDSVNNLSNFIYRKKSGIGAKADPAHVLTETAVPAPLLAAENDAGLLLAEETEPGPLLTGLPDQVG